MSDLGTLNFVASMFFCLKQPPDLYLPPRKCRVTCEKKKRPEIAFVVESTDLHVCSSTPDVRMVGGLCASAKCPKDYDDGLALLCWS